MLVVHFRLVNRLSRLQFPLADFLRIVAIFGMLRDMLLFASMLRIIVSFGIIFEVVAGMI